MECAQPAWPSDLEYMQQFRKKITEQRVPLSGSIDLTHRCNLRCVHCYLGNQEDIAKKRDQELNTEQWISIIDEITEAGCLYLLITGGDPLLRKDFVQIYRHAKQNGLLVTIFTNGTLVTDELLQLFEELPPHAVEISLYGATSRTYEKITGVKGSYKRCISGIERLLARNIRVRLKTILMTLNHHEFDAIEQIAIDYGVPFRFDAIIFPKLTGDKSPLQFRVTPQEAIEKEFSNENRIKDWINFDKRIQFSTMPPSNALYLCGTGINSFHINAYGMLQPCMMVTSLQSNLLSGSFSIAWENDIPKIRTAHPRKTNHQCTTCNKMAFCGYCPPTLTLETGSTDSLSVFLCDIGRLRRDAVEKAKELNYETN